MIKNIEHTTNIVVQLLLYIENKLSHSQRTAYSGTKHNICTTVCPGAQHQDPDFTLAADLCYYLSFPGVTNVSLRVAVM